MSADNVAAVVRDVAGFISERGDVLAAQSYNVRVELSPEQVGGTIDAHVRRVCESADTMTDCMENYSAQEMHPHDINMLRVAGRKAIRKIHAAIRAAKIYHGDAAAKQRITVETKVAVGQAEKALATLRRRADAPASSTAGTTSASAATVPQPRPVCQNNTDASAANAFGRGDHEGAGTGSGGTSRSANDAAEPELACLGDHEVVVRPAERAPSQGAHWQLMTSHAW